MLTSTVDNLQMVLLSSLPHLIQKMQNSDDSFEPVPFPEYQEHDRVNGGCRDEAYEFARAEPSKLQASSVSAELVTVDHMEAAFRNGMAGVVACTAEHMGILEDRVKGLETSLKVMKDSSEIKQHSSLLTGISKFVEGVMPASSETAKSQRPKMSREKGSKEKSTTGEGVCALGQVPKGQGRPRCLTCGRSFLCVQTRAAHEFLSHGYDGSRPECGEEAMTEAWAVAQIEEAEVKAKVMR